MPGVAPDGVDITLERRVLTIRGRSVANDRAGYRRNHNEFIEGESENIDRDHIEATLDNEGRGGRRFDLRVFPCDLRFDEPSSALCNRGRRVGAGRACA